VAVLVYKSLHGLAPQYLVEDCELVAAADRRQLRSSDIAMSVIPRTCTHLGEWAFLVAGPRLWNSLPSNLLQFRRALKTYLFGWLRLQHLVTFVFSVLHKCSYLLTYSLYNLLAAWQSGGAFSHDQIQMSLARGLAGWWHAGRISWDKEIGLIIRLYVPKKEMRYNIYAKLTFWKLKLCILYFSDRQRHRHITLVERLKSHTATSEALVMSQAKLA